MKKLILAQIALFLAPSLSMAGIFCGYHLSSKGTVCSDKNQSFHLVHTQKVSATCEEVIGIGYYYEFRNNLTGEVLIVNDGGGRDDLGKNETRHFKGFNQTDISKDISFYENGRKTNLFDIDSNKLTVRITDKNNNVTSSDLECKR